MTSMWMLERADGTLLEFDRDNDPVFDDTYQGFASADKALIESYRESEGGHLVEMVPAKPKVPVSQEEADMLEKAKNPTYRPSFVITEYSNGHKGGILGNDLEDRLIRAYVDGYTVVESTKYNVKVPHTREVWYYKSGDEDLLTICPADKKLRGKFTESEIKHYGLEDCERVEINTEDSDDN